MVEEKCHQTFQEVLIADNVQGLDSEQYSDAWGMVLWARTMLVKLLLTVWNEGKKCDRLEKLTAESAV